MLRGQDWPEVLGQSQGKPREEARAVCNDNVVPLAQTRKGNRAEQGAGQEETLWGPGQTPALWLPAEVTQGHGLPVSCRPGARLGWNLGSFLSICLKTLSSGDLMTLW